jgi:hypothetical protein
VVKWQNSIPPLANTGFYTIAFVVCVPSG